MDDDLFSWTPRDLPEGRRRRDAGMDTALKNERRAWTNGALAIIEALPAGWRGIGEDIRFAVREQIGNPHVPQVWGGLIAGCIKRKWLVQTGDRPHMADPSSHARTSDQYERLP